MCDEICVFCDACMIVVMGTDRGSSASCKAAAGTRAHQHWAGLSGKEVSSAMMQQLLQGLALHSYLGHILTHTRTGLCKVSTHNSESLRLL